MAGLRGCNRWRDGCPLPPDLGPPPPVRTAGRNLAIDFRVGCQRVSPRLSHPEHGVSRCCRSPAGPCLPRLGDGGGPEFWGGSAFHRQRSSLSRPGPPRQFSGERPNQASSTPRVNIEPQTRGGKRGTPRPCPVYGVDPILPTHLSCPPGSSTWRVHPARPPGVSTFLGLPHQSLLFSARLS